MRQSAIAWVLAATGLAMMADTISWTRSTWRFDPRAKAIVALLDWQTHDVSVVRITKDQ
jgi:hypothetical protein